jgi:SAM-dependent methyltransferase
MGPETRNVIFGGHWQAAPPGWLVLEQADQDISRPFPVPDGCLDRIFSEHVLEHVNFEDGVRFLSESLRALKPGGLIRVVTPAIDKLALFKADPMGRWYALDTLRPFCQKEEQRLNGLGLDVAFDPLPFLFESLIKKHGHQFVWSTQLLAEVMRKLGYSQVHVSQPGVPHFDPELALERTIRTMSPDRFRAEFGDVAYDPESCVIEAKK